MSNLQHVHMTATALGGLLGDLTRRVRRGDSMEGYIEYRAPNDDDPPGFRVRGSYRINNTQGQGGVRLIGKIPNTTTRQEKQEQPQ